jgi:hypothetical protein
MADFRKLSFGDLVDFIVQAATQVANGIVSGFLVAQNTAISDSLTDMAAVLAADNTDVVSKEEAANAAREKRYEDLVIAYGLLSDLKQAMHSVNAPGSQFEAVGFDAPDNTRSQVIPQTPKNLSGTGYSNGTNALKWECDNRSGSVLYMIEVKIGDTAPYVGVGATRSKSFRHVGCQPGQFYQYRVRSEAARGVSSEWSDPAVVYGI